MARPHEEIEGTLRETGGHIKATARQLGISRITLWRRMKAEPHLRDILHEVEEETTDDVEEKLITAAKAGEPWAVRYYRFFLSTQAKHRGYSRTVTVEEPERAAPAPGAVDL